MKKLLAIVSAVCFGCSVFAPALQANAYKAMTFGTQGGLKAAFIGEADDWTAIYWNPAGLAAREGNEVAIEPHYTAATTQYDGNSVKNYQAPPLYPVASTNYDSYQGDILSKVYPTEPNQFTQTKSTYRGIAGTSGVGGYVQLGEGLVLGFGAYSPLNINTDWEDTVVDSIGSVIKADYFSGITSMVYNISAGYQINELVAVGGGVNYITESVEQKAKKTYTSALIPAMNYLFDAKTEADGDGIEGVAGIMLTPSEELSIGGVFRTGSRVYMDGTARALHSALGVNERSDMSVVMHYPQSYGLGCDYRGIEDVTLTFDWERTDWTKEEKRADIFTPGAVLVDTDLDYNWRYADAFRMGAEYAMTECSSIKGGFGWEKSPTSEKTMSMTNIINVENLYLLGIGYGYRIGSIDLEAGYQHGVWSDETVNGVKYSMDSHIIMLASRYHF